MKRITKYITLLAIPALMAPLGSCSDFLEIDPQNVITFDQFWNEKADVDGMVTGCYAAMQSTNVMERMMIWGEFRSDNISTGPGVERDNVNLYNILRENLNASNGYTTWDQFYYVINQANTIIKYAPGVAAKDPSFGQSELAADIAEVSALRDLCYFYLIRTFRDVPYTTEAYTQDDQVMDLPVLKFDAVLDSLINDLENVKNNAVVSYPETEPLYQTGRITRTAIYAMLCDMYLWKQDYQNCVKYADLVIADKQRRHKENQSKGGIVENLNRTNGFPLIPDQFQGSTSFGRAFSEIFGSGNSDESIFELTFMPGDAMPSNGAVNNLYYGRENGPGFGAPSEILQGANTDRNSTQYVYYRYDTRYFENVLGTYVSKYVVDNMMVSNITATSVSRSIGGYYAKDRNKSNWIVYRLSDVMLMKAEALAAMMGNEVELTEQDQNYLNEAFKLVNAVNKRSVAQVESSLSDTLQASNYLTKEAITSLVLAERQRELMFEGKRWYDLVRAARRNGSTRVLTDAVQAKYTSGSAAIINKLQKMDAIYWPYNNDELKVNKNITQNPAFSSGEDENYEKTN